MLTISAEDDYLDHEFSSQAREEIARLDHVPSLEQVHRLLREVPGSFSELIVSEREDR